MTNWYAHNDHYHWIEKQMPDLVMSELGKQVANIIGYVGRGIYNAPFNPYRVKWDNPNYIELSWNNGMSNYDGQSLTDLVIECHRRMIRVTISPNMRSLKLQFWQRYTRIGSRGESIPDIESMIEQRDIQWCVVEPGQDIDGIETVGSYIVATTDQGNGPKNIKEYDGPLKHNEPTGGANEEGV